MQIGAELAFYKVWKRRFGLFGGGGRMIKALFTMILLSNEHAARLVERFQRLKA